MNLGAPSRTCEAFALVDIDPREEGSPAAQFLLPILPRSATLLNLLLQDDAIDLELASAVVALDPGLAFAVLQLANSTQGDCLDLTWQLPQAIVAAGRCRLQQLVNQAPTVDSRTAGSRRRSLQLAQDAVVRACIAHELARGLGRSNPKKCFLGGLLFELPEMLRLNLPGRDGSGARFLPAMCHCLPSSIVRAIMMAAGGSTGGYSVTVATIHLANRLLTASGPAPAPEPGMQGTFGLPYWQCWPELDGRRRCSLLESSAELARWARTSVDRLNPWDFMAKLERRRPWG